ARSGHSTSVPRVASTRIASWFAIVPEGTYSAASLPSSPAANDSRRLTVGSSPYTSSPTSASAIARRISGVGLVTVSERRSTVADGGWVLDDISCRHSAGQHAAHAGLRQ